MSDTCPTCGSDDPAVRGHHHLSSLLEHNFFDASHEAWGHYKTCPDPFHDTHPCDGCPIRHYYDCDGCPTIKARDKYNRANPPADTPTSTSPIAGFAESARISPALREHLTPDTPTPSWEEALERVVTNAQVHLHTYLPDDFATLRTEIDRLTAIEDAVRHFAENYDDFAHHPEWKLVADALATTEGE